VKSEKYKKIFSMKNNTKGIIVSEGIVTAS